MSKRQCFHFLKRKYKRRTEGSISLFLVFVLIAILMVQQAILASVKLRNYELRCSSSVELAAELTLAQYDKSLSKQYGLLAFRHAELPHTAVTYLDRELNTSHMTYELSQEVSASLSDEGELEAQIVDYMKLLYPSVMIDRVFDLKGVLSEYISLANEDADTGTLIDEEDISSTKSLKEQLSDLLLNRGLDLAMHAIRDEFLSKGDGASRIISNFFLGEEEQYEGEDPYEALLSEDEQDFGDAAIHSIVGFKNELSFDVASLANSLASGIELLDFDTPLIYERLLIAEYILDMTSNWQDQKTVDTLAVQRENLRGVKINEMVHSRALETEFILTGVEHELGQKAAVGALLSSTRLAIHTISLLQNEVQMQNLSILGGILSVALAAMTGGSVMIEPQVMKYVLLIIRAQVDAIIDINNLLDGQDIKLLPHHEEIAFETNYQDYLRIFLLLSNQEAQLDRLCEVIETNLLASFHTGVQVKLNVLSSHPLYQGFTLTHSMKYHELEETDEES